MIVICKQAMLVKSPAHRSETPELPYQPVHGWKEGILESILEARRGSIFVCGEDGTKVEQTQEGVGIADAFSAISYIISLTLQYLHQTNHQLLHQLYS